MSSISAYSNITSVLSILPCDVMTQVHSIIHNISHVGIILDRECPNLYTSVHKEYMEWNRLDLQRSDWMLFKPLYVQPFVHPYQALMQVIEAQQWDKIILLYDDSSCKFFIYLHICINIYMCMCICIWIWICICIWIWICICICNCIIMYYILSRKICNS